MKFILYVLLLWYDKDFKTPSANNPWEHYWNHRKCESLHEKSICIFQSVELAFFIFVARIIIYTKLFPIWKLGNLFFCELLKLTIKRWK